MPSRRQSRGGNLRHPLAIRAVAVPPEDRHAERSPWPSPARSCSSFALRDGATRCDPRTCVFRPRMTHPGHAFRSARCPTPPPRGRRAGACPREERSLRGRCRASGRRAQPRVDRLELLADRGPDEAGRASEQHPHRGRGALQRVVGVTWAWRRPRSRCPESRKARRPRSTRRALGQGRRRRRGRR